MSETCKLHPVSPSPRCRICKSIEKPEAKGESIEKLLKKPENKHGPMAVWGDKNTWNISSLMRKNVLSSAYFNKELFHLRDLSEVIDQINKHVQSIEPWIKGTCNNPTSMFCILIKLFLMKLTEGMLRFLLDNSNIYVKVAGILYIRFLANPAEYWDRFKELVLNQEMIPNAACSVSQLISQILTEQDFFGLQLPRIPAPVQNLLRQKVAEIPARIERFRRNLDKKYEKDSTVFVLGQQVDEAVFKGRNGNYAHVQVKGKDMHVHLSEIDEKACAEFMVCAQGGSDVFALNKNEYMKKSVSYKQALMFKIPEKRCRSSSPEQIEVKSKPALEKHSIQSLQTAKPEASTEYFKLG